MVSRVGGLLFMRDLPLVVCVQVVLYLIADASDQVAKDLPYQMASMFGVSFTSGYVRMLAAQADKDMTMWVFSGRRGPTSRLASPSRPLRRLPQLEISYGP